jgi:chloramphenicol 3-O-phosphotransferase
VTDVVFLNGTVGAGKTTVADAVGNLERRRGRPHAVIDLDQLRRLWPSPHGDRFQIELVLQNLQAVSDNYRRAGAEHLILAGVIESAAELSRYRETLDTADLFICRLTVSERAARQRLRNRHAVDHPKTLEWHLARTLELADILDRVALDDLVLDTTKRTPAQLARAVHRSAGWS